MKNILIRTISKIEKTKSGKTIHVDVNQNAQLWNLKIDVPYYEIFGPDKLNEKIVEILNKKFMKRRALAMLEQEVGKAIKIKEDDNVLEKEDSGSEGSQEQSADQGASVQ